MPLPRTVRIAIGLTPFGVLAGLYAMEPKKRKTACTPSQPPKVPGKVVKREGYLSWEDYFMGIAMLAGQRSKDPVTQVGACIANEDKKIVGVGYNGMPTGLSDDDMPWGKTRDPKTLEDKNLYVCHAEINAVLHSVTADLKGCTVYTTLFPCDVCARYLIQTRIKEVVYYSNKKAEQRGTKASAKMLEAAKIELKQYIPKSDILSGLKKIYEEAEQATPQDQPSTSSSADRATSGDGK